MRKEESRTPSKVSNPDTRGYSTRNLAQLHKKSTSNMGFSSARVSEAMPDVTVRISKLMSETSPPHNFESAVMKEGNASKASKKKK